MKILKKRKLRWALIGVFLSFLGPLGEWMVLKLFSDATTDSLMLTYFYTEFVALISLGLFGYMLGLYTDKIEVLALHDKLTGLYNRHYLIEHLEHLLAMRKRYKRKLSLMMIDLDNFKRVNDSYGHVTGDLALKAVSECVRQRCRESDVLARYGGEEFIIICPDSNIQESYRLAERIRESVEQLTSESLGFPGPQTVSIGACELSSDEELSIDQLFSRVDKALYRAKEEGRNKVFISTQEQVAK
jgi:diguanylate cyclase (GGDEF)-like protein